MIADTWYDEYEEYIDDDEYDDDEYDDDDEDEDDDEYEEEYYPEPDRALAGEEAKSWARKFLDRYRSSVGEHFYILSFFIESTGLYNITILNKFGVAVFQTLAVDYRGTREQRPMLSEVYPRVKEILEGKEVIWASNISLWHDAQYCLERKGWPLDCTFVYLQEKYDILAGDWNSCTAKWEDSEYPDLFKGKGEPAYIAAQNAYLLLHQMASPVLLPPKQKPQPEKLFPPVQLFCVWHSWQSFQLRWWRKDKRTEYFDWDLKRPEFKLVKDDDS